MFVTEYILMWFLRKSGLFASLTASLSAARSGIQGFLEKYVKL